MWDRSSALAAIFAVFVAGCGDDAGDSATSGACPSCSTSSGGASGASGASGATGGSAGAGQGGAGATGGGGAAPTGWPGPDDTGIPDGACSSGLVDATDADLHPASGATIECVRFIDDLPYIGQTISGVTFRHCRFELSSTSADAFVNVQGADATFEESEFAGGCETWIRASYEGNGLAIRRSDFSGMANAAEWGTSNVVIEDNWVHDFGDVTPDQHADGFQTDGAASLVIRHNTIELNDVAGGTSAIGVWADLGDVDDALVENNLVAGGGYTVYPGVQGGGFTAKNVRFTGNHFSTKFYPTCGMYGPKYPDGLPGDLVWQDNVWHDGPDAGKPVD